MDVFFRKFIMAFTDQGLIEIEMPSLLKIVLL